MGDEAGAKEEQNQEGEDRQASERQGMILEGFMEEVTGGEKPASGDGGRGTAGGDKGSGLNCGC